MQHRIHNVNKKEKNELSEGMVFSNPPQLCPTDIPHIFSLTPLVKSNLLRERKRLRLYFEKDVSREIEKLSKRFKKRFFEVPFVER